MLPRVATMVASTKMPLAVEAAAGRNLFINHHNSNSHVYYQEEGAGFPLVLIHGQSGNSALWALLMPKFSEHYRFDALLDESWVAEFFEADPHAA
jgi:hypothetical protein